MPGGICSSPRMLRAFMEIFLFDCEISTVMEGEGYKLDFPIINTLIHLRYYATQLRISLSRNMHRKKLDTKAHAY